MDLLCFSHLRWNFVYQRPQHLMSRFANYYSVYYIEEPVLHNEADNYTIKTTNEKVTIVVPHLNNNDRETHSKRLHSLINTFIEDQNIQKFISWYYSPMALMYTGHLHPLVTIYDCMDELSAFRFAPVELQAMENNLFEKADIVFTGGQSLYKVKKQLHNNIYAFPSSIEKEHFVKARDNNNVPNDQQKIPKPILGFFGVLDERFDTELIKKVAEAKPGWQFVFIGPVVKINYDSLPRGNNIHYLGIKNYNELPEYISGWDIALIPFVINESTRFISPTKTPEYLAAGKPVISTAIEDVIHPYGEEHLVHIIHSAEEFINAATFELGSKNKKAWLKKADEFLADNSWNNTWHQMQNIVGDSLKSKQIINKKQERIYV